MICELHTKILYETGDILLISSKKYKWVDRIKKMQYYCIKQLVQ